MNPETTHLVPLQILKEKRLCELITIMGKYSLNRFPTPLYLQNLLALCNLPKAVEAVTEATSKPL
jgi:hypothetical protein